MRLKKILLLDVLMTDTKMFLPTYFSLKIWEEVSVNAWVVVVVMTIGSYPTVLVQHYKNNPAYSGLTRKEKG